MEIDLRLLYSWIRIPEAAGQGYPDPGVYQSSIILLLIPESHIGLRPVKTSYDLGSPIGSSNS